MQLSGKNEIDRITARHISMLPNALIKLDPKILRNDQFWQDY